MVEQEDVNKETLRKNLRDRGTIKKTTNFSEDGESGQSELIDDLSGSIGPDDSDEDMESEGSEYEKEDDVDSEEIEEESSSLKVIEDLAQTAEEILESNELKLLLKKASNEGCIDFTHFNLNNIVRLLCNLVNYGVFSVETMHSFLELIYSGERVLKLPKKEKEDEIRYKKRPRTK